MSEERTTARLFVETEGAEAVMRTAGASLRGGGVVVFPTETFYGLAVRPQDDAAVARLAQIKQRLGDKPLPLIAASPASVTTIGPMPTALQPLAEAFWPGPLTLAIEATGHWPDAITGNGGTIGVRVPGHELARRLAEVAGGLITSTSANPAGAAPPQSPSQLDPTLIAACDVIVDGGLTDGGEPSTIVGLAGQQVVVHRVGAIDVDALAEVLGYRPRAGSGG